MKKPLQLLFILPGLFLVHVSLGQNAPYFPPTTYSGASINFVRTWQATAPGQTAATLQTDPVTAAQQTTSYFDGFGRPMQSVLKQGSPLGNDMVKAHLYNTAGLEQYQFLPFTSVAIQSGDVTNNGLFKVDGFMQEQGFYNEQLQGQSNELYQNGENGTLVGPLGKYNWSYRITDYEASPLNRVVDNYPPGANWSGTQGNTGSNLHNIQVESLVNPASDNVQMWSIAAAQGSIPTSSGAYGGAHLYKSITQDEEQHQVIAYKDTYGQTILKKIQNTATADNGTGSVHSGWLCTYYVYDDNGNLRFIIPPAVVSQIDGTWTISQTVADELCYRFEYDALNRKIITKTPGTPTGSGGEVWTVYDVRNRPVMMQDGNMRSNTSPQWLCTLYDGLNRPIMTGTITSSNTLTQMQTSVTEQTGSNTSGTLSGAAPPTIPGNLTLSLPSESGTSQASQSITMVPGFSTVADGTFTAMIVPQTTAPVTSTMVVNNNPVPTTTTVSPLTATFYDNYNWMSTSGAPLSALLNTTNTQNSSYFTTSYYASPSYAAPITQSNQIQGQQTGTMTVELGGAGSNIYSLAIYDDHGRLIQTQRMNFAGGLDILTSQYSFSGLQLNNLVSQTDPNSSQSYLVGTANSYDPMGRLLTIAKTVNGTVAGTTVSRPVTTIVTNQYNELGQLQQATLGSQLETQQFTYNIRGWQLGMNAAYAETPGTGSNYFGYAIGYDYTGIAAGSTSLGNFATPAFNGNTAGVVWKTKGDNQIRKYDYSYYNATNWLSGANFNQFDGTQFDKSAGIDFSVSNMTYDANGNIGSMYQNGWLIGGSQQIDQLAYHYLDGNTSNLNTNTSNRIQYVADNSAYNSSNPSSTLGDFHYSGTKPSTSVDYGFDHNVNVTSDANRLITSIAYNYLNLPQLITFANNNTIRYLYDAVGHKLQKTTTEYNASVTYNGTAYPTTITTTTSYMDGSVYKSLAYTNAALASLQYTDNLQFISSEKGRIRSLYNNAATPSISTGFAFDYFLRDQLKNVRMVLTDEQWQDVYPAATVEPNTISNEENYYQITNNTSTVIPVLNLSTWWPGITPSDNYPDSNASVSNPGDPTPGATSTQVYKLNGATGSTYGLGITLKVMAGDAVSILGKSVWNNTGTPPSPYPLSNVLLSFLTSFVGTNPVTTLNGDALTGSTLYNSSTTVGPLSTLLNNTPAQSDPTVAPKAGINWILFNDQFVPVSMGTDLVGSTGDVVKSHSDLNIPMTSNGYLYVYASNESNIDVFFDNLQVVQTRGPILEETHYYPVGLVMAGISDRSWNKLANFYHFQGQEMQNHEFSNGTGLEEHDFNARFYDQQIGRWHNQDPAHQDVNPYIAMSNSWPNGMDPNGTSFWSTVGTVLGDVGVGIALGGIGYIGASLESTGQVFSNVSQWNNKWWEGALTADILAASAMVEVAGVFSPGASIGGLSPSASSIVKGAASGVFTQVAGTLATNYLTHQQIWQWDEVTKAAVAGIALGAFSGANPNEKINPDGSLSVPPSGGMLGLRSPAMDEDLLSSWGNETLYNIVSVTGGSIASNWVQNNPLLSKLNVPIGPTPFQLTFGKGQQLFSLETNAVSAGPGILEAIWGESNNLWPNAYYYFNPSTFRQSFGGDNVLQEAGSLIKNFVFNQIIPWED
jgi:RHS repeat-associated protein